MTLTLPTAQVHLILTGRKTALRVPVRQPQQVTRKEEAVKLNERQIDTLTAAIVGPLRRLHDADAKWPAHHSTLRMLVGRGLLDRSQHPTRKGTLVEEWKITDAGRDALKPREIQRRDTPTYMARSGAIRYRKLANNRWAIDEVASGGGDYTSDPRRSIDTTQIPGSRVTVALEVVDASGFAARAVLNEQERRRTKAAELDDKAPTERLELIRLVARSKRMNINRDDRLIRHLIDKGRTKAATARLAQLETDLGQRAA